MDQSLRQETVGLLRGMAAGPLLSCLGQVGTLTRMQERPFSPEDLGMSNKPTAARAVLTYLVSLGLLAIADPTRDTYTVTQLGQEVFSRYGAFCLLDSYRDYFSGFQRLLFDNGTHLPPEVDRALNVLGSGQAHARRFFPAALNFFAGHELETIIDVGCGDGCFLQAVLDRWPHAEAFAVDLSPIAISTAKERLRKTHPAANITGVVADGCQVQEWTKICSASVSVPPQSGLQIVSAWFLVHEFANGLTTKAVEFFETLRRYLPKAELIVGELVNVPPHVLAATHSETVLPEFLLFHALSEQGVLSWKEWQSVLHSIPYTLVQEQQFDVFGSGEEASPSHFVWRLRPQV